MMRGGEPADADARAAMRPSVFGTIHPQLPGYGSAALQADIPHAPPVRLASVTSLETTFSSRFAPVAPDTAADQPTTTASLPSFEDRFAFQPPAPATRSLRPSIAFADRFAGTGAARPAPVQLALADPRAAVPPAAPKATAAAPHTGARALAARVAPKQPQAQPAVASAPAGSYRVASIGDTPIRTAYASVDAATRDSAIDDSLLKKMTPRDAPTKDASPGADMSKTAIYDISRHTVYLPNGQQLEAHSGLAEHMDDIRSVTIRSHGPTPPNVYQLTMRESRFHGIDAIRLNPVDETKMYGRDGILAHPYMLGPNGQSNGCVSLKDYEAFLAAFRRGEFNRLVVVERMDDPPGGGGQTATGWIADKLKGIFGRS
jgi:hypothetical protein